MKKINFIFILILFSIISKSQDTIKVLFIGNSFTYSENMPDLFRNIAESSGYKVKTQMYAPGGVSVGDISQGTMAHMNNPLVYENIRSDKWDFVVLQDNQGRFVLDYGQFSSSSLVIQGHLQIRDSVLKNNPCAKMIWFSGWGLKNGMPPYGNTGIETIERITANYYFLNDSAHQIIAPIGSAWKYVIQTNSMFDLWSTDEAHPSLEGAFLTANVIYTTIFKDNPMYSPATAGLANTTVNLLKQTAWQTVNDSIFKTNLNSITPDLLWQNNQLTAGNYSHYNWFKNMTWLSTANTNVLNVNQSGHYFLIAENANGCGYKSLSQHLIITDIGETVTRNQCIVFPNPVSNIVNIHITKESKVPLFLEIINANAQCVKNIDISENNDISIDISIDVSIYSKGLYVIKITDKYGNIELQKLIIR